MTQGYGFGNLSATDLAAWYPTLQCSGCAVNGEVIWTRWILQPRILEDRSVLWDGVLFDITEQRHSQTKIHYFNTHDSLTELPNREFFDDRINAILPYVREAGKKFWWHSESHSVSMHQLGLRLK